MKPLIYLDNNATTKVDSEVLNIMLPYFSEHYGNAASLQHKFGKKAAEAIHTAKLGVMKLIDAEEKEVIFTSGATESINLAIKGIYNRYQSIGKHIITCKTEHKAVLAVCSVLEKQGAEVTYLSANTKGEIDLNELEAAIREDTILISLMYANNETGVVNPVREIAEIAISNQILFFCDATQAVGKIPVSVKDFPVDLMAFSSHKIYGPKGVGVLYVKRKNRRIQIEPVLHGGGNLEHSLSSGTLNVPAIVGFGAAALKAQSLLKEEGIKVRKLRDYLEAELLQIEESMVNGAIQNRLPNVCNISFRFLRAESVMASLPMIAMSTGSACSTGSLEPSHVLLAMGLSSEEAHASLRLSLGRFTTKEEIDLSVSLIRNQVNLLREESPVWMLFKKGLLST